MTGVQNKELSFVVIEHQLIGWHPIVNVMNAWLNAQLDVVGSPAALGLKDK